MRAAVNPCRPDREISQRRHGLGALAASDLATELHVVVHAQLGSLEEIVKAKNARVAAVVASHVEA